MNVIKANQNPTRYDKFIIEKSNNDKQLTGYYSKLPKIDGVTNIFNEAYTVLKGHLNGRSTADYIQTILHWYWPNIYLDCEQYVNKCLKFRMHKIHKNKRVIKLIRTKNYMRDIK